MMNKESKKNYIEEMKKNFSSNEAVMIAQYQGLNVKELDLLRKELREIFYWPYSCSDVV
jgi:ribosomal protein L10